MLSAEGIGKNIEKAIENALLELRATREDVDIKILEEGGFLKKAKVIVTISEDSKDKYTKKTRQKTVDSEEVEELDVKAIFADLKDENIAEIRVNTLKENKELTLEETKDNNRSENNKTENNKSNKNKKDKSVVNKISNKMTAKDFIKGFLENQSIDANVFVEEDLEKINISIEGGNSGELIGHRGECLNAIQYISSIIENNSSNERKRVVVDIEKYRARREESLKGLANRISKKVEKTNKSIKLEPMNAAERRIIHTELQKNDSVTTISKGTEPNRFIIVLPKKEGEKIEE